MIIKRSLAGMIASNAFSSVREAKSAHDEKAYDREVQNCVIAQLLLGLTIEGAANEAGDFVFPDWPSERFGNADPAFKWWFLSAHNSQTPFDQGNEPLQTVSELLRIRNRIAHPKIVEFKDLHIQNIRGDIERNVSPNRLLQPGESPMTPTVQFLEDYGYNYSKTLILLRRAITAVVTLRNHLNIDRFRWADQLVTHIDHLEQLNGENSNGADGRT